VPEQFPECTVRKSGSCYTSKKIFSVLRNFFLGGWVPKTAGGGIISPPPAKGNVLSLQTFFNLGRTASCEDKKDFVHTFENFWGYQKFCIFFPSSTKMTQSCSGCRVFEVSHLRILVWQNFFVKIFSNCLNFGASKISRFSQNNEKRAVCRQIIWFWLNAKKKAPLNHPKKTE